MAKESVLQLIEAAENTPELLTRLQKCKGAEDVLSIASELNYEFNQSELLNVMQEKQLSFTDSELLDEELESIAGGKSNSTKSLNNNNSKVKADQWVKGIIPGM